MINDSNVVVYFIFIYRSSSLSQKLPLSYVAQLNCLQGLINESVILKGHFIKNESPTFLE